MAAVETLCKHGINDNPMVKFRLASEKKKSADVIRQYLAENVQLDGDTTHRACGIEPARTPQVLVTFAL